MPRRLPAAVIKDPNVMGGMPVIKGTRVPAFLIAALKAQGASELEILETYPYLSRDQVRAAVDYAATHPDEDC